MKLYDLPVAVIGAGPIGLATAARLVERGLQPLVLESGKQAGSHIREWGHVRLFSPWKFNIDAYCGSLLARHGWAAPDLEDYPTGREFLESYLLPLSAMPEIAPHIRFGARVEAVSRLGQDKLQSGGRAEVPFQLRVRTADGVEMLSARAVIDASGTWSQPNPLGSGGILVPGEDSLSHRIGPRIPDILGADRDRFIGRTVLVAGSGDSALTVIASLGRLQEEDATIRIVWATRRQADRKMFGGGAADQLPERGRIGLRAKELVERGHIRLLTGFRIAQVEDVDGKRLRILALDGRTEVVDRIIASTGFRPELTMLRELRLNLNGTVECPIALGPLIDPELHSCGTVPPHGAAELMHPEPDFYIVGMKSYGRAPTFLMLTGYEQVRSVTAAIAGDKAAASAVELQLPETGVCCDASEEQPCSASK